MATPPTDSVIEAVKRLRVEEMALARSGVDTLSAFARDMTRLGRTFGAHSASAQAGGVAAVCNELESARQQIDSVPRQIADAVEAAEHELRIRIADAMASDPDAEWFEDIAFAIRAGTFPSPGQRSPAAARAGAQGSANPAPVGLAPDGGRDSSSFNLSKGVT